MHRPTIAIIAIVLISLAISSWFVHFSDDQILNQGLKGAFVRLSIVMAALWLAHPQLLKYPLWFVFGLMIVLIGVLLAAKPRLFLLTVPIVAILWTTRKMQPPVALEKRNLHKEPGSDRR